MDLSRITEVEWENDSRMTTIRQTQIIEDINLENCTEDNDSAK